MSGSGIRPSNGQTTILDFEAATTQEKFMMMMNDRCEGGIIGKPIVFHKVFE
jgi:hypothetical protein